MTGDNSGGEKRGHVFRRLVHISAPVFLTYYLVPDELVPGLWKGWGALFIMTVGLAIDLLRLRSGKMLPGQRQYERERMSAHSWAALGLAPIVLFSDFGLALPVICAFAWVDPLMGELRARGSSRDSLAGFIAAGSIYFVGLGMALTLGPGMTMSSSPISTWLWLLFIPLSLMAGALFVLAEKKSPVWLNDDLTTLLVPWATLFVILNAASVLLA